MAKFYIQLENRLLQISGELTAENISKALGYVPVSPNVTNELSQRVDNITFDSLKDNPFLQDGSGELNIVDEAGNIIAKIDAEGIHSVDFIAGTHRLSNKTDKTYVDEAVKNVEVDLTGYATEEYVNNIDFYNIKDNPIVNNGDGKLLFVDENGYIGLQLEEDGLYVKDVIADGHKLSDKANVSDIPSLDGYATESYVNTNLQNYATKDEVSDLVDMSVVTELQGKVDKLITDDTDKSVRDIAVDVLTETLVSETATEAYDTLAEMSAWIKSHPEDASAMNTAIQKNATDITNLDAAYKAADVKVLTDAQEYTDNINFYTIKDNPILDNNDGNLTFVDESGNIGLQFSNNAILVNDVVTPEHTLSSKADKSELPTKISELENDKGYITSADIPEIEIPSLDEYVKSEDLPNFNEFAKTSDIPSLEGYAKLEDIPEVPEIPSLDEYVTETELNDKGFLTEHQDISHLATKVEVSESIADIDFYDIQNNPVVNTEEGKLLFVDETGNIGLLLEGDVLYVKDVVANNHVLSEKANKNYVDEEINYINTKINSYNTTTQTIELTKNWNWVSFYVETSLEKLQNALGTKGIEIKHMDFTTSYDEELGLWLPGDNPLTVIEPSKMYMINANSDCVIELEGKLLEKVEITLNPGVNWIAYPLNVPMDVNMALINFEVTDGDVISSNESGFAEYLEGWGWGGLLNTLKPGQGYIYTNNSSETITFKYPTELDIKLLNYETKEDSISKLQESKDYTDIKTDELRDVVTQTLSLTSGGSWCSFYVDITLEQLQQALGTNAASITTSFDGNTEVTSYYNAYTNTWSGNLTTLDITKMYQIYINTDCEIHLTGRKIPNSTKYILNPGWNWISFPMNTNISVAGAFEDEEFEAQPGDRINSKGSGYSEYYEGYGWFGTLTTLQPGQGYMYQNTSTEPKTLVFTTELIDTKSELNKKQDVITDLDAIRQGAAKGATALLEHQDISSKADVYGNPNGIVVKEDNPQNSINIHPRGIIESESWKYNEAFSTEWIPYFLLSGNSLSLGSGVSTDDGFKIEAVLNIRTQDRSDEEFLRTSHTMILLYDERGNSKGTGLLLTDDFILLYAYNPESEIDISENMTELEVPFNDSIFDTRLRGIAEPVSNHDAVNKKYVDDNYVSVNNIKTINGQSLLGEGDIVISGGSNSSGGAYALVEHGTNDTTFTLTPNTFHTWGEVGSLTLILGEEQSGVANEFLFQFESGETATTLTLPDDLIWANDDTPVIESNYTYQVSILKGFAAIMKFKKKTNLIENKLTVTNSGMYSTFTFEYPVASDVSVTFTSNFGDTDIVTIYSGSMSGKTNSAPGYNSLTNNNIDYITPKKDSVYVYTF